MIDYFSIMFGVRSIILDLTQNPDLTRKKGGDLSKVENNRPYSKYD